MKRLTTVIVGNNARNSPILPPKTSEVSPPDDDSTLSGAAEGPSARDLKNQE